jgi:F-type H+-transporting ATPase subunit a
MAVPISAEKIFTLGGLPVTNSLVNGWVAVFIFICLALVLRTKPLGAPRGAQNAAEALIDYMLGFIDQVTHDRARSRKFLPIVGTLFLFILLSNWLGLVPGVGSIGVWQMVHGELELVPLFRPATSDLNMTLAMGIAGVLVSHVLGVATIGFFRHSGKFIQVAGIWKALRRFGKVKLGQAATDLFVAIIELMVGFIELISEVAKMISLSLRLFGNIFAGEVLLYVFFHLVGFILPVPFIFLELVVGIIQAMIFSTLVLVYLTVATEKPHGDEERGDAAAAAHKAAEAKT